MTGTVTLTLEIELAWGLAHTPDADPQDRHSVDRRQETETLQRLLAICNDLDLSVSFDVVGHLLLDSCDGCHDGPHQPGWFDADPGTDSVTNPLYYAPDLVERIRRAQTDHELCTHTFSHARCDEVREEVLNWELDRVAALHAERGLQPVRSFVPPVHAPPPRDVLINHNIHTVRRPVEYRPPIANPNPPANPLSRALWYVHRSHPVEMLLRKPVVRPPIECDGLVETYTSWHASLSAPYLPNGCALPHPVYRMIPRSSRQQHHRRHLIRGLRDAAANDENVHYWSHLFNISNTAQWPPLQSFLKTLAGYRDRDMVRVETMAELGERVT